MNVSPYRRKNLICSSSFPTLSQQQPARHSKLEKADILEMTVKYLQNHQINLQRQQAAISQATDATIATKFKAGFTECVNEVDRFQGMEPQVKRRLLMHLSNVMNGEREQYAHQVHMLPSPPSTPEQDSMSHITTTSNGYYLTNRAGNAGVQLIPTKLSNGNIAFVLPQQPPVNNQVPLLVPIPSRTASNTSATSSSYEQSSSPYNSPPSPANSSYESMECTSAHQQQIHLLQQQRSFSPSAPISLVMRKTNFDQQMKDDEKMWRPW